MNINMKMVYIAALSPNMGLYPGYAKEKERPGSIQRHYEAVLRGIIKELSFYVDLTEELK